MSSFTFHLPDIGEGVVEGEVVSVLVKEGDLVKEDQILAEVMTDKATVQIPSPKEGTIQQIHVKAGEVVPVEAPMFTIIFDQDESSPKEDLKTTELPTFNSNEAPTVALMPAVVVPSRKQNGGQRRTLATPATRRLARELGVTLQDIAGSGKDGRVTKSDVERASQGIFSAPKTTHANQKALQDRSFEQANNQDLPTGNYRSVPLPAEPHRPPHIPTPSVDFPAIKRSSTLPVGDLASLEERLPLRGLRKTIAQNMVRAKFTAPHFTYVEESDVTELVLLRERTRMLAQEQGVKLSFLPFIVKAVVAALRKFPIVNSSLDDDTSEIILKHYYHIGIATATEGGLTVVVVRDADKKSLLTIAREIDELAQKAREGKATRDEMTGSTFTITSLGKLGGLLATPILNYPEVAIMGVHKIAKRPVVWDDQIVIRNLMNLSLSFDHRVVDGVAGATFTQNVVRYLENPELLFLEGI